MGNSPFGKTALGAGVILLFQLSLVTPSAAWCLFNCDPTVTNARAVLQNLVHAIVPNASFKILQFQKTNGSSISAAGMEGYQLFYHAVVEFPSGIEPGRRKQNIWGQLLAMGPNMSAMTELSERGFRVIKGNKIDQDMVMQSDSSIVFQKTEKGWLGPDGRVY